jgi:hypothetical protein
VTAAVEAPEIRRSVTEECGAFTRTVFPNGTEVFYRESDHAYYGEAREKGGNWVGVQASRRVGVSTPCKHYDGDPDNLLRWTERLTLEGVVQGFQGQSVPEDPHILRQLLENRALRWWQIRDARAAAGTNIHKAVAHALALGEEVPDLGSVPEDQRGFGQAVLSWWLDRQPEVSHAEQIVGSVEHRFAGTLDLRCKIQNTDPFRPGYGIVDYKTTESGFVKTSAFPQPAGYDLGGLHSGLWDEPAEWLLIVYLFPDGKYREVWSPATHESFLRALAVYRESYQFSKIARAA